MTNVSDRVSGLGHPGLGHPRDNFRQMKAKRGSLGKEEKYTPCVGFLDTTTEILGGELPQAWFRISLPRWEKPNNLGPGAKNAPQKLDCFLILLVS